MMKGKTKPRSIWKKLLLLAAFSVCILFFAPGALLKAEAKTIETDSYAEESKWTWDYSNGARYMGSYARVVNKKTGEVLSKGWHKVDYRWYYFEKGGYLYDTFHGGYQVGLPEAGYYWEGDTPDRWSWKQVGGKWKYVCSNGDYIYSPDEFFTYERIDGKLYTFDKNGYLQNPGWIGNDDTGRFYINQDGSTYTGWLEDNGKWYFFDYYDGYAAMGGKDTSKIGQARKTFYFFDEDYALVSTPGWNSLFETYWVYIKKDGRLRTGWFQSGKKWYYLDPYQSNGEMIHSYTDETEPNYSCYIFIDGYYIDEDGVCRDGNYKWHKDKNGWWFGKGKFYVREQYAYIDGKDCQFDANGYLVYEYDYITGKYTYYME